MQKFLFSLTIIVLFAMYSLTFAQNNTELTKVTDQLYMISGMGGNVSFLVTDEGVLVVDAGFLPGSADKIKKYIKSVTEKPIKYLVLTHYHLDHSFGISGFGKGITIIGHENVTNNLKTLGQGSLDYNINIEYPNEIKRTKQEADSLKKIKSDKWKESYANYKNNVKEFADVKKGKIILPDITFNETMNIYLGKDTVSLKFPGNTHTSCNILVEFPNQNAIVTGDFLFSHIMPYIDFNAKCNTKNWIDQLRKLETKNFKYIIPGHGKLASGKDLLSEAEYLSDLRDSVQFYISRNKTISDAQREIRMQKYSDFGFQYVLPLEIEAVYKELKESKSIN